MAIKNLASEVKPMPKTELIKAALGIKRGYYPFYGVAFVRNNDSESRKRGSNQFLLTQHRLRQVMGFEQVAKSHQRGGIGYALLAQADVHEMRSACES